MGRLPNGLCMVSMLVAMTGVDVSAWGQIRLPAKADLPPLAVEGTIEQLQMARGLIMVKSTADQPWILQFQRNSRVDIKGKAKTDFLAPGQCVIFSATIDTKTGKIEEKVSKLTIFSPDMRRTLGVFPDQGFGAQGADPFEKPARKTLDKPAPRLPGGGSPALGGTKGRPARGAKAAVPDTRTFDIHGQIIGLKNGKFSIRAPNPYVPPVLTVEIEEEADIDVELAGLPALALVRPGDRIRARCQQVAPTAGQILEAEVTLSQPLSAGAEGITGRKKLAAKHAGKEKHPTEAKPAENEDASPPGKSEDLDKKPAKKGSKPRKGKEPDAPGGIPKEPEA